jgi:prepilin signal peptidase PulO-like enzyme (type II secretory pathway)
VTPHAWLAAALFLATTAAVYDLKVGKIPDVLTLGALVAAPIAQTVVGFENNALAGALLGAMTSIGGAIIGGLVPLLLLRSGALGGGDAKLFLAIGAITWPAFVLQAQAYAFCFATLYGLVLVARRRAMGSTLRNALRLYTVKGRTVENSASAMTRIRFAPSVLVGCLVAVFVGWQSP